MNCLAALTLAALALARVRCHELSVLSCPESVQINQSIPLHATELADIVSAMLGFTVPNGLKTWKNLMVFDPFLLPEAVVVLEIPGFKDLELDTNDKHNLLLDTSLNDVYATVESRMKERLANKEYSVMHGSLTNEEFVKNEIFHPNYKLNPSFTYINADDPGQEKYRVFYNEIFYLQQLQLGIKESYLKNNIPDFHWFQLQGVKTFTKDASSKRDFSNNKIVLYEAINNLVISYNEIYDNNVVIITITSDAKQSLRHKRETDTIEENLNVAEPVSSDYPVIFNLLLWFTVIFVFSLLAISLSIGQMDPGRDSIIYRMTSNRMKKEN